MSIGTCGELDAVSNARHRSRSHDAMIRVSDDAGNVIETHERERFIPAGTSSQGESGKVFRRIRLKRREDSSGTGGIVSHFADASLLTISFSRSRVRTSPHCRSAQRRGRANGPSKSDLLSSEKALKPPTSKCSSNMMLNSGKSTMLMPCVAMPSFSGQTQDVCADTLCRRSMTLANSCEINSQFGTMLPDDSAFVGRLRGKRAY